MIDWGYPDCLEGLRQRLDSLPGNDIVIGAFDRLVDSKCRPPLQTTAPWDLELRLTGVGSLSLRAEVRRRR